MRHIIWTEKLHGGAFNSLLAHIQAGQLDSDTNWGLWQTTTHCWTLFACVKTLHVPIWKKNGIISNYSQCCGIIWLIWVERHRGTIWIVFPTSEIYHVLTWLEYARYGSASALKKRQVLVVSFTCFKEKQKPWNGLKMTMSSPVGPRGIPLAKPIPVPTLTVLPPSSDTESWSRSPSPILSRSSRHGRFHRSRTRTKKRNEEEQGCNPRRQWGIKTQVVMEESVEKVIFRHQSRSPSPSLACQMEGGEQGQDSPSQDHLLPPPHSWSRSPSPSRRSRWSLRSLLSRDSDWESCRLVSWIHPK